VTSGAAQKSLVVPITGIAIPVVSGDRLYLNVNQTGTLGWRCFWFVYVAV